MPQGLASTTHRVPVRGHLLPLDGVRGLAILMVIFSHAFESNSVAAGPLFRLIGGLFYYGYLGVDLFFVLSGFLITGILYDSLGDAGYFRKFYARRALRIFPLYYGVLAVCFLLTYPLHLQWHGMGWLLVFYLQNLHPMQIMRFSAGHGVSLYHFWSLAVEEQFYLVWPAVVFFVRTRRGLLWTTVLGAAGAVLLRCGLFVMGVSAFALHTDTACRADALLLGGTLALLYRSSAWNRMLRLAPWGFAGLFAVFLLSLAWLDPWLAGRPLADGLWHGCLRYSMVAVMFACLIACSLRPGSALQSVFKTSGLRFLGKYSYGIYVLHVLLLGMVWPLRVAILNLTHSKALSVAVAGICTLSTSVAAAWLSYHLYERPFLRMKHLFDYDRPSLNHGAPEDADNPAAPLP